MASSHNYKHVTAHWKDSEANALGGVDELVYRSNCLGRDQRITNTGGGNTSAKITETDPVTGEKVEVLWVKGSGGDLRTAQRENFSSLYQEKLTGLQKVYGAWSDKGLKSPAEDDMVGMYAHCTFNLNPRPSSIDTPLHSFIPHPHVDHTHPNAAIAVAACARSEEATREIYGDEVVHLPWMRPGFELGLAMQKACADHPRAIGFIMGQHGLISWGNTGRECYERSLGLIDRAATAIEDRIAGQGGEETIFGGPRHAAIPAETRSKIWARLLPWLRGQVSKSRRFVATVHDYEKILRFVDSHDAPRLAALGTSCPDHFLRTKIKPLYIDLDTVPSHFDDAQVDDFVAGLKEKLAAGLETYRLDYTKYY